MVTCSDGDHGSTTNDLAVAMDQMNGGQHSVPELAVGNHGHSPWPSAQESLKSTAVSQFFHGCCGDVLHSDGIHGLCILNMDLAWLAVLTFGSKSTKNGHMQGNCRIKNCGSPLLLLNE